MTIVNILKAAREKIADPRKWTKKYLYSPPGADVYNAKCWCPIGAIYSVTNVNGDFGLAAISALENFVPGCRVLSDYNDNPRTTHADIIALFDRAIVAEEKRAAIVAREVDAEAAELWGTLS